MSRSYTPLPFVTYMVVVGQLFTSKENGTMKGVELRLRKWEDRTS
jgi:hypothetical protein